MTHDPVTIDGGLSVVDARQRLFQTNARHLPVYVGGHLVGILSDRDLARVAAVDGFEDKNATAEQVCTPNPYVVGPDAPLAEVAQTLAEQKFGAALVMNEGQLLGIFTTTDALHALVAQLRPVSASLRADPARRDAYAALKRDLAARAGTIDEYIAGKTDFLLRLLADAGLDGDQLRGVEAINRPPT